MTKATIKVEGAKELLRKLARLSRMQPAKKAVAAGTLHLAGVIAVYPMQTIANAPRPRGKWYERGYGTRWMRRDGSKGGRKTSEMLGRKWSVKTRRGGLQGIVGNSASYAPFVQSAAKQASFHGKRGWLTDEKAKEKARPVIEDLFKREVEREFSR